MSKQEKKAIREAFRTTCFERDRHQCVMCGCKTKKLDAHHIEDRHDMPNGGYVPENGITLCAGDDQDNCHWKAEQYHATGTAYPGYSPEDLFAKIGSSLEQAWEASEKLGEPQTVADKIVRGLQEGLQWARGERPLRVTTFKQTPDGNIKREVGEKYRDEI
jgi:hypothetical protein